MSLTQAEVAKLVDTVVVLVRKIETLVNGRPQYWLHDRDWTGLFPDTVFE
ncbi:MAG TPA: hypothetical protein VGP62_29915 [Bryobacteraceae bacterium]|jgi:hypothetical protein|nr:hypothetical protein [Bryobacteraceae bacterium]